MSKKTRSTRTSPFGSAGRSSHDSSAFYAGKLYRHLVDQEFTPVDSEQAEQPLPVESVDRVFCSSAERMQELPDCSVHLMVTSPPYNVILSGRRDDTIVHRNLVFISL